LNVIRGRLQRIPDELFMITVDKEGDSQRLRSEVKVKRQRREKGIRDQISLFGQRELFDEETYRRQMFEMKRQVHLLEEEITVLERQIEVLFQEDADPVSLKHYAAEFKRLELGGHERTRLILHDLIKRVTLSGDRLVMEYAVDFSQ
jgi:hypothetical protein